MAQVFKQICSFTNFSGVSEDASAHNEIKRLVLSRFPWHRSRDTTKIHLVELFMENEQGKIINKLK